jgi:homoserine O-acetyltransferase
VEGLTARMDLLAGFSQAFYRERLFEKMGFPTLDAFLIGFWEAFFLAK